MDPFDQTSPRHRQMLRQKSFSRWLLVKYVLGRFCFLLATFTMVALVTLSPLQAQEDPDQSIPFLLPARQELGSLRSAALETEVGTFLFELFPEKAPWHVANLLYLSQIRYFEGKRINLRKEGSYLEFGAPSPEEQQKLAYSLPPEFSDVPHHRGALSMARSPLKRELLERRSSSTNIHILLADNRHMQGSFTSFGKLIGGSEHLDKLREGTRINRLIVYRAE